MAAPLTAAITGWCSRRIVAMTSSSISIERNAMVGRVSPSMFGMEPGFSWSAPEQKPLPAPVITTMRTELSVPTSRRASRKGIMTSNAMAFIRSGRFSVTTATPGCGFVTSVKDMARHRRGAVPDAPELPASAGSASSGSSDRWCDRWCVPSWRANQRSRAARASQS